MPGLKLMGELGLDGSGFEAGFRRAKGIAAGVSEGIKSFVIQAIGVGTIEQAISKTVETAKELVETSERLAIAPEQLQVMRQAAKQTGMEFDKLADSLEKVDVARQKALIPGNEGLDARRAFAAAGIHMDQLKTMTAAQLFQGPLRTLVNNRNPEEIGIIFRELGLGLKGGLGQIIPYLKTDFDALSEKMKKMGAIMDTETAVKLKALSDGFSLLAQIITSQVGPALLKFAEWAYGAILKAGGNLAAGAAAIGAGTANMSGWDTFTSGISAIGHIISHSVGFLSDEEYEKKMAPLFDYQAAEKAMAPAKAPYEEDLKNFQQFLYEAAQKASELNNPKPANFNQSAIPPKLPKSVLETPVDSLIRVGNFLGSGSAINRLAQRRTDLLQQIANNTSRYPNGMGGALIPPGPRQFIGDASPTFFPIA